LFLEINMPRRVSLGTLAFVLLVGALVLILAVGFAFAQDKTKKLPPPAKPIDINSATIDQLHSLPGVGPVIAQRILDYRKKSGPFVRVDDLLAVQGISSARMEKIRPYVMVKEVASTPTKAAPPAKTAAPVKKESPQISHPSPN
jgi:competence ComEA-like helix-hairpin-helix protein